MITIEYLTNKYCNEFGLYNIKLPGLYSNYDADILYAFVRELQPANILDIAPREGKTTSCILNALLINTKNNKQNINYFIFEKDEIYLNSILEHIARYKLTFDKLNVNFNLYFDKNIIHSEILNSIDYLDFVFIDANHDYFLSKYLTENVCNLVKPDGWMHFHDMFINDSLENILFKNKPIDHPEIIDLETLRSLYPGIGISDQIVDKWEGDNIYNYIVNNNYKYIYTSNDPSRENFNCSLYVQKNNGR